MLTRSSLAHNLNGKNKMADRSNPDSNMSGFGMFPDIKRLDIGHSLYQHFDCNWQKSPLYNLVQVWIACYSNFMHSKMCVTIWSVFAAFTQVVQNALHLYFLCKFGFLSKRQ